VVYASDERSISGTHEIHMINQWEPHKRQSRLSQDKQRGIHKKTSCCSNTI